MYGRPLCVLKRSRMTKVFLVKASKSIFICVHRTIIRGDDVAKYYRIEGADGVVQGPVADSREAVGAAAPLFAHLFFKNPLYPCKRHIFRCVHLR